MSHRVQIYTALKRGEKITHLQALQRWGCARLAARIYDLRRSGHKIVTHTIQNQGKRYAQYILKRQKPI